MHPQPRHPCHHGGAAGGGGGGVYPQPNCFLPNPNSQFPFNPQYYQLQPQQQQLSAPHLYFQNPNFQNPLFQTRPNTLPQNLPSIPQVQNPNFQNPYSQAPPAPLPRPQNVPLNPQVTMEKVDSAVSKAQGDLVTAGENVTAWKVSQATLVSLQVDSWSSLGLQLQNVPSLRHLLAIEGKERKMQNSTATDCSNKTSSWSTDLKT